MRYVARRSAPPAAAADALPTLILGDDSEWVDGSVEPLAGGASIRYDAASRSLVILTSIVALPPVYLARSAGAVAITSDLHLLRDVAGLALALDPQGITELGHFGHPVGHRTLFKGVEMLPASSRIEVREDGEVRVARTWEMPQAAPLDWPGFIEAQVGAFSDALRRIDVRGSFLSLTAGLDTRTVFSLLAAEQRLVPAATLTGAQRSLDARIAARLCDAYGVVHEPIVFDAVFRRDMPRFVETASRLSGGLESVGQAPEVFLYDQLRGRFGARISGNLGNQVGRGGTEGVSIRGARLDVLSPDARGRAPTGHWLLEQLDRSAQDSLKFILEQEIAFTLAANFSVGSHFAVQQSPYASRALIETLAQRPRSGATPPSRSVLRMRLRDLHHRFLGEPLARSFQRTLVRRIGGFAAECPVNWGWRPVGGVSPTGLAMGGATLAGMYIRAKGIDGGVLQRPVAWSGLPALHDFRESRRWVREDLRDFTHDTLASGERRNPGLFNGPALQSVLDEHFEGRADHYHTVTFALDVALADRIFCGRD